VLLGFKHVIHFLRDRWQRENGYRQVLKIAIPLALSMGSVAIMLFVDRMFLTWHSAEAVAASMPAGMLNFALMTLFMGTAGYTSTFVAQYQGAGLHKRIGPTVWQGIYISLIGGTLILALVPFAGIFFRFVGHDAAVRENEIVYFRILTLGAMPFIASAAIAGFYSGRGKAWPIMWVNVFASAINATMDYVLIFGHWGFPELGIRGAAIATVISASAQLLIYLALLSRPENNNQYLSFAGWRFERALFARLMKFGLPNGLQFFINMIGLTVFILLMGRLGAVSLAATNIAINVNILAFLPMIGVGIAISVLVGQSLGRDRPDLAERSVSAGAHICFIYMATAAALYWFAPGIFLSLFAARADAESFAEIRPIAVVGLRFVAVFSLFDTLDIIFSSALKGAGDTRFIMSVALLVSTVVLVIPSFIALVLLEAGIAWGWGILTAYIIVLGFTFLFRYKGGKWKSMRVTKEGVSTSTDTSLEQAGVE
jgi:MATE family multidrug resistance protein